MTSRFEHDNTPSEEEDTAYDQIAKAIEDSITEVNDAAIDRIVSHFHLSEDEASMIVAIAVTRVLCIMTDAMGENGHAIELQSAGLRLYAQGMEFMASDKLRSTEETT